MMKNQITTYTFTVIQFQMTHPGEKRMVEYAKDYGKILPKNFEENLTSLFSNMFSDKENTLLILENIVTEIKKVI